MIKQRGEELVLALAFLIVGVIAGWLVHNPKISVDPEVLKGVSEILKPIVWLLLAVLVILTAKPYFDRLLPNLQSLKVAQMELVVRPPAPPTLPGVQDPKYGGNWKNPRLDPNDPLPLDYLSLAHSSYYSPQKQELPNFRPKARQAGYFGPVFDFRVWLVSYYPGALDSVDRVEYFIGRSWDKPIQNAFDRKKDFELHELTYVEFIILAKVHFKENQNRAPLLLSRWINIPSGILSDFAKLWVSLGKEGHENLRRVAATSPQDPNDWPDESLVWERSSHEVR